MIAAYLLIHVRMSIVILMNRRVGSAGSPVKEMNVLNVVNAMILTVKHVLAQNVISAAHLHLFQHAKILIVTPALVLSVITAVSHLIIVL